MLKINTNRDIQFNNDYIIIDSDTANAIMHLNRIDHCKLEHHIGNTHDKSKDDIIMLYNENHSILYRLLFNDKKLARDTYEKIKYIIYNRTNIEEV